MEKVILKISERLKLKKLKELLKKKEVKDEENKNHSDSDSGFPNDW